MGDGAGNIEEEARSVKGGEEVQRGRGGWIQWKSNEVQKSALIHANTPTHQWTAEGSLQKHIHLSFRAAWTDSWSPL